MRVFQRPFAVCVAALALGTLVACSSPEERVAEYMAEGQRLMEEGDYRRAAVNFRNALRLEPQQPQALFQMGKIFERRENYRRAYAAYQAAAQADPTLIEALNAYAVLALSAGELEPVQDAAARIREVAADHPDGLALEAALALRAEDTVTAKQLAEQALAADPAHVNATSALVGALYAENDVAGAMATIDAFFAANGPDVPLALLQLQIMASEGDNNGIEVAFRQLLDFDDGNVAYRLAFAEYYRGLGDIQTAESVLRTAIAELDTAPAAAVRLVRMVRDNNDLETALQEIERLSGRDTETDYTLAFLAADMLAAEQRFDEAQARLEAVLEEAGEDTQRGHDANAGIATIDFSRGDREAARARIEALLEDEPTHRGGNYLLAVLQLADGDVTSAVGSGRAALQRDPSWVPALKVVAQAHMAAGDRDLAIDALQRSVEVAPGDIEAASALAQLLSQRGDYDAALQAWDLVINGNPDATGALSTTAEIAIRQENWNRASSDIDRLLATPGAELSGTLLAGSLRLAQGDADGARQWFERAREMDPEGAAPLLGLVRTYVVEEDLDGALAHLEERTAQQPGDALAHNLLAQLHTQAERFDAAVASYRAAIEAQPTWGTPYRELAVLVERQGQVDEALALLEAGIAAEADGAGQLQLAKAFVLQRAERYAEAIAIYEAMLDAGDERDLVVNNYAALVADFAYEDPASLRRALELAERFQVSSEAYFLDTLGWLNFRQGEYSRALAYLRRASALLPDDPHIRYHVGATLLAMDETEAAREELELALVAEADYIGIEHARALLADIKDLAQAG